MAKAVTASRSTHSAPDPVRVDTVVATPRHQRTSSEPDSNSSDLYWPAIGTKDEIPAWLRDNDYIITGHPMPTNSYRRSWRFWRCLHMETMNIWTHLVGSTGFIATGVGLHRLLQGSTSGDKFAFAGFLTSAAVCFGLSTAFHTLRSHSYNVHHFWGKMDILGICVLALGAGTSMIYYAFYCRPVVQRIYWSLNLCSALAAAFTLLDTGGGGSKMRTLRGGVFSLLTVSAMLPLFHSAGQMGWVKACEQMGANWYVAEGLALLVGVCLFVGRIPERFSPGRFDIWGHSHQLFHVCAVMGGWFHLVALMTGYRYRQAFPQC